MPTKAEAFKLFPLFLSEFVSYTLSGELYLSLLWKNLSSNLLLLTTSALDQFNLCAAAIIHPLLKKSSLIISHLQVSASTPHFITEHRREMNYINIHQPSLLNQIVYERSWEREAKLIKGLEKFEKTQ